MKYYKRFRPSGEPFYIDEGGNEVSESVAKKNLVVEAATGAIRESRVVRTYVPKRPQQQKNEVDLVKAFKLLGLTEKEALIAAGKEPKQVNLAEANFTNW